MAEAGSDSQLQFVTAFASAAATPAHAETVRALRDGDATLEGLEIDTDLSWQLLVSLASAGVVTAVDIDEARAADNTAKGGEFAALAKASLPSHAAKQEAWDSLIERTDAPNTIVRSTAAGFTNPATVDVLADFVEPYFAMLLPIWESRSYQIANYLIVGCTRPRWRTRRCVTRRAHGCRRTPTPRPHSVVSSVKTSPVSSAHWPCRSATPPEFTSTECPLSLREGALVVSGSSSRCAASSFRRTRLPALLRSVEA